MRRRAARRSRAARCTSARSAASACGGGCRGGGGAGRRGERLWRVPLDGGRAGAPQALLDGRFGRLRTVAVAPDGSLWVTTSNRDGRGSPAGGDDRILRVAVGASR